MTIGEKIKYLRKQQDITQEELATAAGTTKQTIHKYETGIISNIPASKIKAMSDKLHTTPAYLMGWEDTADTEPQTTLPRQTGEHLFLSPIQQQIISNCQQLNETGQKKVLDFSDDLISSNNYPAIGKEQGYKIAALGGVATQGDDQPPIEEKIIT